MVGKYQAYPEYKDSGAEWLGPIPQHWELKRVKEIANVINGYPFDSRKFESGKGTPLVRIRDINSSRTEVGFDGEVPPEALIRDDDILIGMDGDFNVAMWKGGEAALNQRVACVRANSYTLKRFIFYTLPYNMKIVNDLTYFTTVKHLSSTDILKARLALPPIEELAKLVTFLDHETAKIDALIDKQQKLIKLLKEKRQALISHAVTKGLNPDAPMRDSGVEWLGKVPAHWGKSSLGFECIVKARLGWKGLKAEEYVDEGYIFLATPNIKGIEIDFENVNYITKERYEESPEIMLEVGDVLVTKDGSTTGTSNIVRNLPESTTVNSSIAVIRSLGRINSLYLYYFFVSTYTQNVIKLMQGGMGVPHLFQADLKKFTVLMPSLSEQAEIALNIDQRLPKFDLLIEKAAQTINLLQERRTALISAAVTGKIDVRNWQVPLLTSN